MAAKAKPPVKQQRYNDGKPALSYVFEARHALRNLAFVFMRGAVKYARSSWRKGYDQVELADSLGRHITDWMAGEDLDPETGLPHVDMALWNAFILSEMRSTRPDLDTRAIINGEFTKHYKEPVKPPTIEGVPLVTGPVLVVGMKDRRQNGLYKVTKGGMKKRKPRR